MEIPFDDPALRRTGGICVVSGCIICGLKLLTARGSVKLDAEKRLALQEEKQALEAKLLDV